MGCAPAKQKHSFTTIKADNQFFNKRNNSFEDKNQKHVNSENLQNKINKKESLLRISGSNQSKYIRHVSYKNISANKDSHGKSIESLLNKSILQEKKLKNSKESDFNKESSIKKKESIQNNQSTNFESDNCILSSGEVNYDQIEFIRNSIVNNFLFKELSEEIISEIISNLVLIQMNKGYLLFQEGDAGNFYYIVKEGELQLNYSNGESKTFKKGDTFGELALIQKSIRSSSVITLTDVEIYCLEGDLFKEIVMKIDYDNLKERIKIISQSSFFKYFESNKIHDLAKSTQKFEFEKGDIINQDEINNCLLLITQGSFCKLPYDEIGDNKIEKYFGLSNLIFSNKNLINFNLIADNKTKCFRLTKGILFDILGENFLKKILQNLTKAKITRVKMLKLLSAEDYFDKFFGILKPHIYNKNDFICRIQEPKEERKIYVVLEGTMVNVFYFFIFRIIQKK